MVGGPGTQIGDEIQDLVDDIFWDPGVNNHIGFRKVETICFRGFRAHPIQGVCRRMVGAGRPRCQATGFTICRLMNGICHELPT